MAKLDGTSSNSANSTENSVVSPSRSAVHNTGQNIRSNRVPPRHIQETNPVTNDGSPVRSHRFVPQDAEISPSPPETAASSSSCKDFLIEHIENLSVKDTANYKESLESATFTLFKPKAGVHNVRFDTSQKKQPQDVAVGGARPSFKLLRSRTYDLVRGLVRNRQINARPDTAVKVQGQISTHQIYFEHLRVRLMMAVKTSPRCQGKFLPESDLHKLVTQSSLERELARPKYLPQRMLHPKRKPHKIRIEPAKSGQKITQTRSRSTSELMRQKGDHLYQKIFAILAYINRSSNIWDFVDEGVCDADLPILETRELGNRRLFKLGGRQKETSLRCFNDLSRDAIQDFMVHQWIFLPPCFRLVGEIAEHQTFRKEDILPVLCWDETTGRGGSGQVYKVKIHPEYHSFDKEVVAVKELLASEYEDPIISRAAFERESDILKALSTERHEHPHLIQLLATFEQAGRYHLIFPWADADLEEFWCQITPKEDMLVWLIEQCQGLAEALSRIHHYETKSDTTVLAHSLHLSKGSTCDDDGSRSFNLIGRHGDIKPKNILWFRDEGTNREFGNLRITDFGIARFDPENVQRRREHGFVPNSLTYRSPECDLDPASISPQCDVWALGCVYLVFMIWFFGGSEGVQRFADDRVAPDEYWHRVDTDNFFTIDVSPGNPKARVKPAVTEKINDLRRLSESRDDNGMSCLREMLDLIQHEMLIVKESPGTTESACSNTSFNTQPKQRKSSGQIARVLGSILDELNHAKASSLRTSET